MFSNHFYNQTLRRYISTFGNMFSDMQIARPGVGKAEQSIAVPITYAPKEKFLARLAEDPNLDRPVAIHLPAMSFEILSMQYDGSRKLQSTIKNKAIHTKTGKITSQYTPVPWNLNFSLFIYTRNVDDGCQLLEQILPFFGPEWTNSINLVPDLNIIMDVPTILNDVVTEDAYEGDFITRRAFIYTLNFTMKGWFFGPVRTNGNRDEVIRKIILDFGVPFTPDVVNSSNTNITGEQITRTTPSSRVIITPGLLANGSPTKDSSKSIDIKLIDPTSNYDIAIDKFFLEEE